MNHEGHEEHEEKIFSRMGSGLSNSLFKINFVIFVTFVV